MHASERRFLEAHPNCICRGWPDFMDRFEPLAYEVKLRRAPLTNEQARMHARLADFGIETEIWCWTEYDDWEVGHWETYPHKIPCYHDAKHSLPSSKEGEGR